MKHSLIQCVRWMSMAALSISASSRANDSFNAELSHFAGNAAIASITTVAVHKLAPEVKRPALTGFLVSTTEVILGECIDHAYGNGFSMLDVAAGTLGAAVGSIATDKWYVSPRIVHQKNETTCGVMVKCRF